MFATTPTFSLYRPHESMLSRGQKHEFEIKRVLQNFCEIRITFPSFCYSFYKMIQIVPIAFMQYAKYNSIVSLYQIGWAN